MIYWIAVLSVVLGAIAQLLLKLGMSNEVVQVAISKSSASVIMLAAIRSPAIWFGFGFYGLSAVIWLMVLARLPVSNAYPFVSGGIVLVVLLGVVAMGESFSLTQLAGVAAIVFGLILLSQG